MSKKELIAKLLEKLSEEDLVDLLGEEKPAETEPSNMHTINKRRGGGHSKRKKTENAEKATKKSKRKRKRQGRISKGKACRVSPMDVREDRPNKFENFIQTVRFDASEKREMEEAKESDEKARSEVEKQQTQFKKQSRTSSLVDVDCCVCGDEYEVSPAIVHDVNRWKCNTCSTQPGY